MNEQTMPPRVLRWTQKLLDLTLRNRLLNVRETKELLPLACRDLARLEDDLAAGKSLALDAGDLTEAFLVSRATSEETQKRVRHLFRLAKTDLEESGVNTLFLALGALQWMEPGRGANRKAYRAPILLVPVSLKRASMAEGVKMYALDEETAVNTTLVEFLRSQCGIAVSRSEERRVGKECRSRWSPYN